ncbi:MAG: EAL domain-containing protein [Acidimicrobiales bacterium]
MRCASTSCPTLPSGPDSATSLRRSAPPIHVPVTSHQVVDASLVDTVAVALRRSGLRPGLLCLEIDEAVLLEDTERAIGTVRDLKALGVRLAIAGFGTGYSSLSYLSRLPVDVVKIDRSFVEELRPDRPASAVVAGAIVSLAQALGLSTIGEGVANAGQLQELRRLGCDAGLGPHFSAALAGDAIDAFLAERTGHPGTGAGGPAPDAWGRDEHGLTWAHDLRHRGPRAPRRACAWARPCPPRAIGGRPGTGRPGVARTGVGGRRRPRRLCARGAAATRRGGPHHALVRLRAITGLDCPGCGMTRGLSAFVRGRPGTAADFNLLLIASLPLVAYAYLVWLAAAFGSAAARAPSGPRHLLSWSVPPAVAFSVVRNLPIGIGRYPQLRPAPDAQPGRAQPSRRRPPRMGTRST